MRNVCILRFNAGILYKYIFYSISSEAKAVKMGNMGEPRAFFREGKKSKIFQFFWIFIFALIYIFI